MWERISNSLFGSAASSASSPRHSISHIEDDIRRQLAEMERQTIAFHEAIGLLRALLSTASEQDQETQMRLQQVETLVSTVPSNPNDALYTALQMAHELAIESWRHNRLYVHTLRQLYHRLLEAKRRFLYQWHQHLLRQVQHLPEERQPPMTALLDNSLQGSLAVGIGQIELQYKEELEQMREHAPAAPGISTLPSTSRHEALAQFEQLLETLHTQLPPLHAQTVDSQDRVTAPAEPKKKPSKSSTPTSTATSRTKKKGRTTKP